MNLPVLVPARIVDTVPPIEAVSLEDDGEGATVRSLCAMVGIARNGQIMRIRRNPSLSSGLLTITVATPGGPQATDVLVDWAIPLWAAGLQTTRLPKEKRALAEIIQQKAVAAIRRALSQQRSAPEQEAPARPAEAPAGDGHRIKQELSLLVEGLDIRQVVLLLTQWLSALDAGQQEVRTQMAEQARQHQALSGRVVGVEEWLTSLDRRVAALGQGSAAEAGQPPALSAAHQADLRTLLRLLAETTGRTQTQLEQELIETFRAAASTAIPDELWPDVLAWCWWRAQQRA